MRRSRLIGLASVLGVAALVPAQLHAQRIVLGDPVAGERLFARTGCAGCHEARGNRAATAAPDLSAIGRQRHMLELAAAIWNHSPKMNARMRTRGLDWPEMSASATADLLAYVYLIGFADEPGNAGRGEVLFRDKQCNSCHGAGNGNARGASTVAALGRHATPVGMVQAMWDHGPAMQDRMQRLGVQRVTFTGTDMIDLLAYLRARAGAPVARAPKGDWREGERLFAIKGCTRCHGVDSEAAKLGPDLSRRVLPRSASGLAGLLWNHGMRMRQVMDRYSVPVASFSGDELADLTAYLSLLGFIGPPGNASNGRALFTRKHCNRCHAVSGRGGSVGPDLARSQAVLSPMEAARLMWQHAPSMQQRLQDMRIAWPQLNGAELSDLIAYLSSLPSASELSRTWGK